MNQDKKTSDHDPERVSSDDGTALAKSPVGLREQKHGEHSQQTRELVAGEVIANRYKVLSLIGRGAMGSVYKVEQISLKKHLALKTLNTVAASDTNIRRFKNEALAASKLDHANLVRALDYGWIDTQPFLVMDLVEGQTLSQYLKQAGKLPVDLALQLFLPICYGLAAAHQHGVVHRDLKPSNIILSPEGKDGTHIVPKVVDFGIAKLDYGQAGTLTQTGEVFGTPLYMSPEQCLGTKVDGRSDIYALGCVLYESLTGAPPFAGTSALETMMQHRSEQPLPLKEASLGAEFPPDLEKLLFKMLAKEPHDRYQNFLEVAHDLALLQRGERLHVKQSGLMPVPRWWMTRGLIIALTLVLGALIAFLLFNQSPMHVEKPGATSTAEPRLKAEPPVWRQEGAIETSLNAFSKIVGENRVFDFGSLILGTFEFPHRSVHATGVLTFPKNEKLTLRVNFLDACHTPQLFSRFKEDDLDALEFKFEEGSDIYARDSVPDRTFDETLAFFSHLKSLQKLQLNGAPVTMRGLNFIQVDELNKLQELGISKTNIDGKELARMQRLLSRLPRLYISHLANVRAVLRALQGCKTTSSLALAENGLGDNDMAVIATMPNLRDLELGRNSITDKGLAKLTNMKQLIRLRLPDCPVTPTGIRLLSKLPKLEILVLPLEQKENQYAIERDFPHCKIDFRSEMHKSMSDPKSDQSPH